ncbi:MAG: GntR family transcriptional regulator [Solirubrobacterales bacterium]
MPGRSASGIKGAPELINRRVTSDYVADALREAINSGALADGEELNQVAIAEQFGVSRVPVREAMRELQAEGLIEAATHRRAVVRAISLERLTETFEVRALLEGFLIERAIERIDSARVKRLRALEEKMIKTKDHAAWLKLNAKFHQSLLEAAESVTAMEMVEQLRTRGERYTKMWSRGMGIERVQEAGEEHRRILDAVEKGDAKAARRETEAHVLHTRDRLLRLRDDRNGEAGATEEEAPAAAGEPKRAAGRRSRRTGS